MDSTVAGTSPSPAAGGGGLPPDALLECVVNISEGRDEAVLAELAARCGDALLDRHADPDHHRSVFTLVGEDAPRALARAAVERLDIRSHTGVHPRLGVVDVVPFVPLGPRSLDGAVAARDAFAHWAAEALGLPCFLYGTGRSLPAVRRRAFVDLAPDVGPSAPHPTGGACCVGARGPLVAYNVWLAEPDVAQARRVAAAVRSPAIRALGLAVGRRVQVSLNLVDPLTVGPAVAYDAVAALTAVAGAELVGLLPAAVVDQVPSERWAELDLGPDRTIEARLEARSGRLG
jgi:glutamate formiminotransferase/glutamate formiminotransferase/formiminotetrahydrofolate cyclodeaminase